MSDQEFINSYTDWIGGIVIIVGLIIGGTGNILLLTTIIKTPELQSKSGIILAMTAISHIFCLLGEIPHAYTLLVDGKIDRILCFKLVFHYIYFVLLQSYLSFVIVLDLFIAISFPFWYKCVNATHYVIFLTAPGFLYALIFFFPCFIDLFDDQLPVCTSIAVLGSQDVVLLRLYCNIILNTITVFTYIATIFIFYMRSKNSEQMVQVFRRVSVGALLFFCSWYVGCLGHGLVNRIDFSKDWKNNTQSLLMIFPMLCYSQNFYVAFWRSQRYREAFLAIIGFGGMSNILVHKDLLQNSVQPNPPRRK